MASAADRRARPADGHQRTPDGGAGALPGTRRTKNILPSEAKRLRDSFELKRAVLVGGKWPTNESFDDIVAARGPVAVAEPGEAVRRKKARGKISDGPPPRSFSTFMANLGIRCRLKREFAGDVASPARRA